MTEGTGSRVRHTRVYSSAFHKHVGSYIKCAYVVKNGKIDFYISLGWLAAFTFVSATGHMCLLQKERQREGK